MVGGQVAVNCIGQNAIPIVEEENYQEEDGAYHAQLDASADLGSVSQTHHMYRGGRTMHTMFLVMLAWGQVPGSVGAFFTSAWVKGLEDSVSLCHGMHRLCT